jgi:chromosomal replication initiator protein
MPQFRDKYRSVDILLIDDIHFIAGKESTQEEFFNTFNKMHDDQKQIILTSDRPPKDIKTLEERLVTRFEWGIIAEINPPSFELRAAIIKKKAEELSITIDNDIVNFLAEKLQSNIRQIEGAIKKIAAISSLTATPITMDMCKRCVADFISGTVPVSVMCDKIIHCVAEKYNVSVEDIKSSKRNKEITNARHIAVYLMKEMTNMTQTSIGDYLDKDHATINFSLKKIKDSIKESKFLESEISELIQKIKS